MTAIDVERLSVWLRARHVLNDFSFSVASPGLVVIVGPNGAGKSTLLRAIAGLVPAQDGTIRIGKFELRSMSMQQRARTIGYLPQERTVHWPVSARQIVALGRLPHQPPGARLSAADRAAIDAAMAAMDASSLADRSVHELSGGERARVLIARVLAQQPSVILADEPTAGLDPKHQWALFEQLETAAAKGTRIIVALHDLALASRFARHVLVVSDGRLVASGAPEQVLTAKRLASVFGVASASVEHDGRRLILPVGLTPGHNG